MAIYLALVDENPADRKQAERLLSRESSYRSGTGDALYFDTYGSEDAFLPFMEKYDLVFIDIHEKRDGMMLVLDMIKKGCRFPVCLCSGDIDYKSKYQNDERFAFDNLYYLDKPLQAGDYRKAIDLAAGIKKNKPVRLELRGKDETLYVSPEEIIYVKEIRGGTIVSLTDGRSFHAGCTLHEFILSAGPFSPDLISTSPDTMINMNEVASVSGNSFRMSNGVVIRFSFFTRFRILKAWKRRAKKKL